MNELAINWLRDNAPAFVKAAIDAQEDELRAENGRLRAELDEARSQWRAFASMMEFEPEGCTCLSPPDVAEENEPSAHSQYCPIYLEAYARAMADGTELPE